MNFRILLHWDNILGFKLPSVGSLFVLKLLLMQYVGNGFEKGDKYLGS